MTNKNHTALKIVLGSRTTSIFLSKLTAVLILLSYLNVSAQDIHFSQFYLSPLNLNPALTGVTDAEQRLSVNYRNQWAAVAGSGAYNTYSASYDRRMEVGTNDYFGVGGTLWGDVAGDSNFGTTQAKLSFAYTKKISGSWSKQVRRNLKKSGLYLSIGADAGITQRRVTTGDLRWPSQVRNGVYAPDAGSAETIPNDNFIYPDLSGGIMVYGLDQDNNSFYIGAAMHHLNQANISFLNREESLYSRLTIHAGGELVINKRMSVVPNLVYMSQGPHLEILPGAAARFNIGEYEGIKDFFELGLWFRAVKNTDGGSTTSIGNDAIIVYSKFSFSNYSIGFSYDYNTSQLSQAASANGAFELSVTYMLYNPNFKGYLSPRW